MNEFAWKLGGAQGEGIDSTGEIFALTLHRLGYYVSTYRHFASLIKGGHTNYKVRISTRQRRHRGDTLNLLVALDQTTIDENAKELVADGAILFDEGAFEPKLPEGCTATLIGVPFTQIAKDLGLVIMKNMVALGASAALLGLPSDLFEQFIAERFGRRGAAVVESNRKALAAGFEAAEKATGWRGQLPELEPASKGKKRLFMHGNDAIAMGAIVAGCRILAAYPITPATEILYSALRLMPKYGGVVLQAEDEMAACQMAIGANYAGVRAMTSTSGPGLSLMAETLGLAGVSETPVVIVDVQRGGPSTGMPTKTEQADAYTAVFQGHGEIQRIVLTPSTVEECFYDIQKAFNLADRYQCPVIVMTDLALGLNKHTIEIEDIDFARITRDRGVFVSEEKVKELIASGELYKRYEITESGISPRALPGQEGTVHLALSYEHDELGYEMDEPTMRVKQVDKRARKMSTFDPNEFTRYEGPSDPDLLVIGWGSTQAQLEEVLERAEDNGQKVAQLQLTALYPFPADAVRKAIESAKRVLVVENNSTGQLAQLIKQFVGYHDKLETLLKYNGEPFSVEEIYAQVKEAV